MKVCYTLTFHKMTRLSSPHVTNPCLPRCRTTLREEITQELVAYIVVNLSPFLHPPSRTTHLHTPSHTTPSHTIHPPYHTPSHPHLHTPHTTHTPHTFTQSECSSSSPSSVGTTGRGREFRLLPLWELKGGQKKEGRKEKRTEGMNSVGCTKHVTGKSLTLFLGNLQWISCLVYPGCQSVQSTL